MPPRSRVSRPPGPPRPADTTNRSTEGGEDPSEAPSRPPGEEDDAADDKRRRCHVSSPAEGPGAARPEQVARRPQQVEIDPQAGENADERGAPSPRTLPKGPR